MSAKASERESYVPQKVVVAYHERTKHHFHRYAAALGYMDWATQPDPFRRYAGADLVRPGRAGLRRACYIRRQPPVPVGNLIWLAVDRESGDAVVQ